MAYTSYRTEQNRTEQNRTEQLDCAAALLGSVLPRGFGANLKQENGIASFSGGFLPYQMGAFFVPEGQERGDALKTR